METNSFSFLYRSLTTLHIATPPPSPEDTLDHNSWEVSEECLRDNIMLLDNEVLMISNKWRMARGESPLTRESLLISK